MKETTENANEQENASRAYPTWVTDSLILAILPLFGWLLGYVYECGFMDHLGIPLELIAPGSNTMIQRALVVSFYLLLFWVFPALALTVQRVTKPVAPKLLRYVTGPFTLLSVYYYWYKEINPVYLGATLFALAWGCKDIIGSWRIFKRPQGTHREQAPDTHIKVTIEIDNSQFGALALGIATLVVCFIVHTAYTLGKEEAERRVNYLVINKPSNTAILRMYGETALCAKFDRSTKRLSPTFTLRKMPDDPDMEIRLEQIGPLRALKPHASNANAREL